MNDLFLLNDKELKRKLSKMHALDIANVIKDEEDSNRNRVINLLSLSKANDVIFELPEELSIEYFNLLNDSLKKKIINEFEMDELKVFINSFDESERNSLINLLPSNKQKTIRLLMSYDEETIAAIMTTEFVTINETMTIKEATSYVISSVKDNDYLDVIFVVRDEQLVGSVALKDLISARASDLLASITYQINNYLTLDDSVYQGFMKFKNYSSNVLPVIDSNLSIVGIVTADDILEEMIEEHEEDIEKMQAIGNYELDSSARRRAIQRLPWLLVSVLLNLLIALFLSVFERTLTEVIALILFQPMILGMAGNIGTQSIAVTILKLNQDELEDKTKMKKHLTREIGIGFINSVLVGISGMVIAFLVLSLITIGTQTPLSLAVTIGLSLFGAMVISSLAGVFIPVALDKMKIDPAIASGPIISTLNDLFALVVYFGLATLIFML